MPRSLPLVCSAMVLLLLLIPETRALAQDQPIDATTLVVVPVPRSAEHVEAIHRALAHANIAVVYNTGGARSDQSAQRVAERLGVERRPYDLDPLHADRFAGWLLANVLPATGGRAALVIAPADLIPYILQRAGAVDADELERVASDDLFTLTIAPALASLVRAKLALASADQ